MKNQKLPWEDETLHPPVLQNAEQITRKTGNLRPTAKSKQKAAPKKSYSKEIKFAVTLGAIKESFTQSHLSQLFGVPQPLISLWKTNAIEAIRLSIMNDSGEDLSKARQPAALDSGHANRDSHTNLQIANLLRTAADLLERVPDDQVTPAIQYPED